MPHEFRPDDARPLGAHRNDAPPLARRVEAADRAARLNARWSGRAADALLAAALDAPEAGRIALVSSFGAESVVLLHMVARIRPELPVLFIDTLMLFEETLHYQRRLAAELGLRDIRVIHPDPAALFARDVDGILHLADPDGCCALRKTEPLARALAPFDAWITGRKRYQGRTRAALPAFEAEEDAGDPAAAGGRAGGRIKINPLAAWTRDDIAAYIDRHALPRHPLSARGYASIGCAPCTTPVAPGEDPRAGRWRGRAKTECGIHFINGRPVRPGASEPGHENAAPADARPVAAPEPRPPRHDAKTHAGRPQDKRQQERQGRMNGMEDPAPDAHVIVTDRGFAAEDFREAIVPLAAADDAATAITLGPDTAPEALGPHLARLRMIRIVFSSFADGRGFTLARRLRLMGYSGRLRASGHVIADQYAMARRAGFDEVEIAPDLAARQPEAQWRARADWRDRDYQARLRG